MKLTIILELEAGERRPNILRPGDIEKFKRANPTLKAINEVIINSNEEVEVECDGIPVYHFNRN